MIVSSCLHLWYFLLYVLFASCCCCLIYCCSWICVLLLFYKLFQFLFSFGCGGWGTCIGGTGRRTRSSQELGMGLGCDGVRDCLSRWSWSAGAPTGCLWLSWLSTRFCVKWSVTAALCWERVEERDESESYIGWGRGRDDIIRFWVVVVDVGRDGRGGKCLCDGLNVMTLNVGLYFSQSQYEWLLISKQQRHCWYLRSQFLAWWPCFPQLEQNVTCCNKYWQWRRVWSCW